MPELDLSIVIVNYNSEKFLGPCLKSIYAHPAQINFELIVVDNHSRDESLNMLKNNFPQVKIIAQPKNEGFAKAVNAGIKEAGARYILSLNNDTVVQAGALEEMVKFMDAHPEAGAAGPKIVAADGALQLSCRSFPTLLSAFFNRRSFFTRLFPQNKFSRTYLMSNWAHNAIQEVDWVSGAGLMMRRRTIQTVGLMDEDCFLYCEDVDWCYRAKQKGERIFYFPFAQIIHYGGDTSYRGKRIITHHASMYKFYQKHWRKTALLDFPVGLLIILRAAVVILFSLLSWKTKRKKHGMDEAV